MISNPWNLIKGTGYSLFTHRGLRAWEANANGNASANFKFLFVNAYVCIWICVRVSHSLFPCIFICVLYLYQMCEPFFPVHVLRRIRPNKCCKQTEKFSKVCLHHSNLSVSLENGIKKSVSQISQESKPKTRD